MAHPDAELKVGTTREAGGLIWTLYKNQFNVSWKAGPLAQNIVACEEASRTGAGRPYYRLEDRIVAYATFEKASLAAIELRGKEYDRAKQLVVEYEAAHNV